MVNSPPAEAPRSLGARYPRRRPPGPRGLPLIGNLLALGNDPLGFFAETARRYGDLVALDLAGWRTLLVSDLPAIEKILVDDHRNYVKHRFFWRHVTAVFGKGLLTSEGEPWQRQRRLAAPAFAGRQLLAYDSAMVALTRQMLDGWKDGEVIDTRRYSIARPPQISARDPDG